MKFKLYKITKIALMSCVMTVCAWTSIPFAVPFTLQTFAVFCALLLLGGRDGLIAVLNYLLLGLLGVPVFAGFQGGVGVLLGPTGGYLVGFVFVALCYWVIEKTAPRLRVLGLVVGQVLCYTAGTLWFCHVFASRGNPTTFWNALCLCVFPYVLPDVCKGVLALFVTVRVRRFTSKKESEVTP